jgi:hypothetical protein
MKWGFKHIIFPVFLGVKVVVKLVPIETLITNPQQTTFITSMNYLLSSGFTGTSSVQTKNCLKSSTY